MTLCVGWRIDRQVLLFADTQVELDPSGVHQEGALISPYGYPKIFALTPEIVVAMAGDRLFLSTEQLNALYDEEVSDVDEVICRLSAWSDCHSMSEFLVAWTSGDGGLVRIRSNRSCEAGAHLHIGDRTGFSVFQAQDHANGNEPLLEGQIRLAAAIGSTDAPTVGGLLTCAQGNIGESLRVVGTTCTTHSDGAFATQTVDGFAVELSVGDAPYTTIVSPPIQPGVPGLGVYVPQTSSGYFYPRKTPNLGLTRYSEVSPGEFVEAVASEFDVVLAAPIVGSLAGSEVAHASVVRTDGSRVRYDEWDPSEQDAVPPHHWVFGITNGAQLVMRPQRLENDSAVWADDKQVLTVEWIRTDEGSNDLIVKIALDQNVATVAPLAAVVLEVLGAAVTATSDVRTMFSRQVCEMLRSDQHSLRACMDLAAIDARTGQSHRYETNLCEHDAATIQSVRQAIDDRQALALIAGEEMSFCVFEQELDLP